MSASDPDPGDSLEFSLGPGSPPGAAVDPATGRFTWTPTVAGNGTVTVSVNDGNGGTDSLRIGVTVSEPPGNGPLGTDPPQPAAAKFAPRSATAVTPDLISVTLTDPATTVAGPPGGFSVSSPGDPAVAAVAVVSISGSGTGTLGLSLDGDVSPGATLSYDSDTGDVESSATGEPLESFDGLPVSFPGTGGGSSSSSRSHQHPPPAITLDAEGYPLEGIPAWIGNAPLEGAPVSPFESDGAFDFPLAIYGYLLRSHASTVIPQNVTVGQAVFLEITLHDPLNTAYFAAYLDMDGGIPSHLDAEVEMIYDRKSVRVSDPQGLTSGASLEFRQDPADPSKKKFVLGISFAEPVGRTSVVVRTWNTAGEITTVRVSDALDVAAGPRPDGWPKTVVDPEPVEVPVRYVDPEPGTGGFSGSELRILTAWGGYSAEYVGDAEFLGAFGFEGNTVPGYLKGMANWFIDGDLDRQDLIRALEYLEERGLLLG